MAFNKGIIEREQRVDRLTQDGKVIVVGESIRELTTTFSDSGFQTTFSYVIVVQFKPVLKMYLSLKRSLIF